MASIRSVSLLPQTSESGRATTACFVVLSLLIIALSLLQGSALSKVEFDGSSTNYEIGPEVTTDLCGTDGCDVTCTWEVLKYTKHSWSQGWSDPETTTVTYNSYDYVAVSALKNSVVLCIFILTFVIFVSCFECCVINSSVTKNKHENKKESLKTLIYFTVMALITGNTIQYMYNVICFYSYEPRGDSSSNESNDNYNRNIIHICSYNPYVTDYLNWACAAMAAQFIAMIMSMITIKRDMFGDSVDSVDSSSGQRGPSGPSGRQSARGAQATSTGNTGPGRTGRTGRVRTLTEKQVIRNRDTKNKNAGHKNGMNNKNSMNSKNSKNRYRNKQELQLQAAMMMDDNNIDTKGTAGDTGTRVLGTSNDKQDTQDTQNTQDREEIEVVEMKEVIVDSVNDKDKDKDKDEDGGQRDEVMDVVSGQEDEVTK